METEDPQKKCKHSLEKLFSKGFYLSIIYKSQPSELSTVIWSQHFNVAFSVCFLPEKSFCCYLSAFLSSFFFKFNVHTWKKRFQAFFIFGQKCLWGNFHLSRVVYCAFFHHKAVSVASDGQAFSERLIHVHICGYCKKKDKNPRQGHWGKDSKIFCASQWIQILRRNLPCHPAFLFFHQKSCLLKRRGHLLQLCTVIQSDCTNCYGFTRVNDCRDLFSFVTLFSLTCSPSAVYCCQLHWKPSSEDISLEWTVKKFWLQ